MPRQTNKQNSFLLSGDGEWHTDGPVVVSKYTQTKQRLLRAKIVKSGHGKHYKVGHCHEHRGQHKHYGIRNLKTKKWKMSIKKKKW